MNLPRITFGIIVLNGEPFTKYCLRALYPYAHEIIVVEGAVPAAANVATADGHSKDGTLQVLQSFKKFEDYDEKLIILTAEDFNHSDGFWPGEKDEQSQAYAGIASGDYLWQVDIDEFYKAKDIEAILKILGADPSITACTFKQIAFWGNINLTVNGWFLARGANRFHRLFKWGHGYKYVRHRPPTVIDSNGVNLRDKNWIKAEYFEKLGIFLYHYSLLFPKQIIEKCTYYGEASWAKRPNSEKWAKEVFFDLKYPFNVHNVYGYPSYLEYFRGSHPSVIIELINDIHNGKQRVELRMTEDVERLLRRKYYRIVRALIKMTSYLYRVYYMHKSSLHPHHRMLLYYLPRKALKLYKKNIPFFS
jgi:hypothetical protein